MMISRSITATIVVFMLGMNTQAQPSGSACVDRDNKADNSQEYALLMQWIGKDHTKAVALQLAISKYGGRTGKIDGKLGPQSALAICSTLSSYLAIGGRGNDWGINSVSDAPRLIDWLYEAIVANETGSEFPD
jgi:hypothetical protein